MSDFIESVAQTTALGRPDRKAMVSDFNVCGHLWVSIAEAANAGFTDRAMYHSGALAVGDRQDQDVSVGIGPDTDFGEMRAGPPIPFRDTYSVITGRCLTGSVRGAASPAAQTPLHLLSQQLSEMDIRDPAVSAMWGTVGPTGFAASGFTLSRQYFEVPANVTIVWGRADLAGFAASGVTLSRQLFESLPLRALVPLEDFTKFYEAALLRKIGVIPAIVVQGLRKRLSELLVADDWDETDPIPSKASFWQLLRFLAKYPELRTPAVTITNDGNFVATWMRGKNDVVRLEFDDIGWVNWLVLLAPVGNSDHSEHGTAKVPLDKVAAFLKVFRVWEWIRLSQSK